MEVLTHVALREEILQLDRLAARAKPIEEREVQSKLVRLRKLLKDENVFGDPKMKILIFTEHKDTLDYLVGDGKDGRPLGKLREWGLSVTQIHGGMKIGDRDTPGTRICAEREFREECQALVATEAAGEGINLQFCWLMVNYDLPWNPVRLEQRMGRIHRYGQEHDCLIFNFVAINTREGRVLQRLLSRLAEIKDELGSDKVFDVVGEVFPSNLLERLLREMYARQTDAGSIEDRIVKDLSPDRFRRITESTLEGLARQELNLSVLVGKSAEAKERRLVPEVIEDFFVNAGPIAGVHSTPERRQKHIFRVSKIPRTLYPLSEQFESRFGRLAKAYRRIVFDKSLLADDPTLEWVTPGHPLFETVRADVLERVRDDLDRGTVFYDLHSAIPYRLDLYGASIRDGRGNTVQRQLFAVRGDGESGLSVRQPTLLLDLAAAPIGTPAPGTGELPDSGEVEAVLLERALQPFLKEAAAQRAHENQTVRRHIDISLNELIKRQSISLADLVTRKESGDSTPGLAGLIAQAENHLDDLNNRLETREEQLEMESHCTLGDVNHVGRAWVLPHPDRGTPGIAPMVRDDEIEQVAIRRAMEYEKRRGWVAESVESENRGFDLISRKPDPNDSDSFTAVRFIEGKGRAGVGEVALSSNEYRTAQRLAEDYWLYVVFDCATGGHIHCIPNPAQLGWEAVMAVEHYRLKPEDVRGADID